MQNKMYVNQVKMNGENHTNHSIISYSISCTTIYTQCVYHIYTNTHTLFHSHTQFGLHLFSEDLFDK